MSRWSNWSRGTEDRKMGFGAFLKEAPAGLGNPSAALGPAERAKQLGLQSNGKGGYIDPETGEVVARTVNNELIFYDNNAATGGAIADGSGGAQLTQSQPSWADPLTGLITTPPANAESPSEIAAIPDPIPATPPAGYNSFMQKKKMDAYQQNQVEPQTSRLTPDEAEEKDAEQEQMAQQGDAGEMPAFAAEERKTFDMFIESDPAEDAAKAFQKNKAAQAKTLTTDTTARNKAVSAGGIDPTSLNARRQGLKPPTGDLRARARALAGGGAPQPGQNDNVQSAAQPTAIQQPEDKLEEINNEQQTETQRLSQLVDESFQSRWKTDKKRNSAREELLSPLEKMLTGMEEGGDKDKVLASLVRSFTPGKRNNKSSKKISPDEMGALQEKAETLRGIDGSNLKDKDGKAALPNIDMARKFVQGAQSLDVNDDLVKTSWDALPDNVKGAMRKGIKEYGYDEKDGWKKFLQQGGLDAYTGQALDPTTANWEHVIADTKTSLSDDHAKFINSLENMVWISEGVNQRKDNSTMNEFFESQVDGKDLEDYKFEHLSETSFKDFKDEMDEHDSTNIGELMTEENDQNQRTLRQDLDEKGFDALRETHTNSHSQMKESMMNQINEQYPELQEYKDKRSISKAFKDGKIDEKQKKRLSTLHDIRNKVNKMSPQFRRIMESLSPTTRKGDKLPLNLSHKPKRGSGLGGFDEELTDVFSRSMLGKSQEDQIKMMESWNKGSNDSKNFSQSQAERLNGLRGRESRMGFAGNEYDVQSQFYNSIRESMNPEILGRPENQRLSEHMDAYNGSDENRQSLMDTLSGMLDENPDGDPQFKAAWLKSRLKSMKEGVEDEIDDDDLTGGATNIMDIIKAFRQFQSEENLTGEE